MKHKLLFAFLFLATAFVACNHSPTTDNNVPANGVYFVNLKNGDTVTSPFVVQMGVNGMQVEPAGTYNKGKGHHHLIIDGDFVQKGDMVPKDATHIHFGEGQTSDTLTLTPGQHRLTLQFADGLHRSYGKDWSASIEVYVKK